MPVLALALAGCNDGGDPSPQNQAEAPAPQTFVVSGTVSGLLDHGTVVLKNNGGDPLQVRANGTFTFATQVAGAYAVTVGTQPSWQDCTIGNGAGTATADVSNVSVTCVDIPGVVSTLAGSYGVTTPVDGTGSAASFNPPAGIAADAAGNLYVTEFGDGKLRMVTPAGVVTTVASGLGNPYGVAIGADGSIYVANSSGNRIMKVLADGTTSVFAGSGSGASADGTGTAASFGGPFGLGMDGAGNLYVTDRNTGAIRKITPAGNVTTLVTGSPFTGLQGVAADAAGNVYVLDANTVRKIALDGTVTTLAGSTASGSVDGTGAAASFNLPLGITMGADGFLYVAEYGGNLVRRVSTDGVVTTLAGSGSGGHADGTGTAASFTTPAGVALGPDGNLYVADYGNALIRKIGR